MKIIKHHAVMQISEEALYGPIGLEDKRYERKYAYAAVPVSQQDWADYYAAVKGLQALHAYTWTEWGGPDYRTEVPEPNPTYKYEFLETNEEWLARCRKLREEAS